ncbi:SCO4225 family membrane protein [Nocardiopsis valliformis]|uniref:SCO4225 family membrane protein n=1 Tax=Nocardiopsis valliformis TaxID=239974 RepID=UPI0012698269|nr:hypothetical protein [Nocardiopsis valliformis]
MRHFLSASVDNAPSRVYLATAALLLAGAAFVYLGPGFDSGIPELALAVLLLPCGALAVLAFSLLDMALDGMLPEAQLPVFFVFFVLAALGNALMVGLAGRAVRALRGRRVKGAANDG